MNNQKQTAIVNVDALTFIETAAHGYLQTPFDELLKLPPETLEKITRFSYVDLDTRTAYLEEDCDLALFIQAAKINRAYEWENLRRERRDNFDPRDGGALLPYAAAYVQPLTRLTIRTEKKALARALAFVAAAISTDKNRPALNGVAVEILKNKPLALLIATDGRRLHAYSFALSQPAPCDIKAVLTRDAVEKLTSGRGALNLKKADKGKHIYPLLITFERSPTLSDWLAPAWIEIGVDRFLNQTAYPFPNWRQVIPKENARSFTAPIDFGELRAALDAQETACRHYVTSCRAQLSDQINEAMKYGGQVAADDKAKKIEREAKRQIKASELAENLAIGITKPTPHTYLGVPKARRLDPLLSGNYMSLTSPDQFDPAAHFHLRAEYVREALDACDLLAAPPAITIELDYKTHAPALSPIYFGDPLRYLETSPRLGLILIMPLRITA